MNRKLISFSFINFHFYCKKKQKNQTDKTCSVFLLKFSRSTSNVRRSTLLRPLFCPLKTHATLLSQPTSTSLLFVRTDRCRSTPAEGSVCQRKLRVSRVCWRDSNAGHQQPQRRRRWVVMGKSQLCQGRRHRSTINHRRTASLRLSSISALIIRAITSRIDACRLRRRRLHLSVGFASLTLTSFR